MLCILMKNFNFMLVFLVHFHFRCTIMAQKFQDTIQAIKNLQIQSAENVARTGVESLLLVMKESHSVTREALLAELYSARDQLVAARPTEPCLRNALSYVFYNIHSYTDDSDFYQGIQQRIQEVVFYFDSSKSLIAKLGSAKIRHGSIVYTHCHSSTVVAVLIAAKKQGKKFIVHNTETRPLYQGRKTARELALAGICVVHYVDNAARFAMKNAHLCLFGSDAVTYDAVYNKVGSGMFAELLHTRKIPLYICTNSWKFDPHVTKRHKEVVEERSTNEVWENSLDNISIENPAFEPIILPHVTAIISELGVLTPLTFLKTVKKKYSWMGK